MVTFSFPTYFSNWYWIQLPITIGTTVTFFSFHNLPFLFAKKFVLLYLIYYNYFITIVIYYLYSANYIRRWSNALINSRLCLARAPPTSAGKQYPQGLRGEEGRGDVFSKSRSQCWWWYSTGGIPIPWILSVITSPVNYCGLVHLMPHPYLVYSSLSMEKWLLFKLASSTCQIVFKTGAAGVPVRHLNTVIYHAVQKFFSRKHLLDQERQVYLLPGFESRGIRYELVCWGNINARPTMSERTKRALKFAVYRANIEHDKAISGP